MYKTYLVLAFLITGFLLAGDAYGEEEVYYCAETESNGFAPDKKSSAYKPFGFTLDKFKIKLDRASKHIELAPEKGRTQLYICSEINTRPDELRCTGDPINVYAANHLNFNLNNGRFVSFQGFGYVFGIADSISISYGKCDKF